MLIHKNIKEQLFSVKNDSEFNGLSLKIFRFQYKHNKLYQDFVDQLHVKVDNIKYYNEIPFLPVEFFKTRKILCGHDSFSQVFSSSGTTILSVRSKHYIADIGFYEESFTKTFEAYYGKASDYTILALLPSYLEREESSLVYMMNHLINQSNRKESGFFLYDHEKLFRTIQFAKSRGEKVFLIGVSFALLDFASRYQLQLSKKDVVMETGGMKGRKKEILREEVHAELKRAFGIEHVHSEYGMTELLSQAYAKKEGIFHTPPWMKILIRDVNDPLTIYDQPASGGINIIDLANVYSCSFIATQDLGRTHNEGFEVMGRFDNSDVRGCNLMVV